MEYWEMLEELNEMVDDGIIINDDCLHREPADTQYYCTVCFIVNLYESVSFNEPHFTEETTEKQREEILRLWERYANAYD